MAPPVPHLPAVEFHRPIRRVGDPDFLMAFIQGTRPPCQVMSDEIRCHWISACSGGRRSFPGLQDATI